MRPIELAAFPLAISLFVSIFYAHAEEYAGKEFAEHPARTSSRDVKIPRALVERIENDYHTFLSKSEGGGAKPSVVNRQLLNIAVEMTQKRPMALHEDARIVTPLGGGVIDLSEYVTPLRGAFHLKILAHKEDGTEPAGLRVFFISRAKPRILGGEEYGAGCGKFMEITSYFTKKNSGEGFELYTADQRYLSVLGGTFVTVAFQKEALYVGSVSFTDSRYPNLLCE